MTKQLNPPNQKSKSIEEIYTELPKTYQTILLKLANKMLTQSEKGVKKYGTNIDENQEKSTDYWENHLLEEIADSLVYLEKILQNRNF